MTVSAQTGQTLRVAVVDAYDEIAVPGATVELLQSGVSLGVGSTDAGGVVSFIVTVVGTIDLPAQHFQVSTAYPNPSPGRSTIPIELDRAGVIYVQVTDLLGRVVVSGAADLSAGGYSILLALDGLARGTYFARIRQGSRQDATPIVLSNSAAGIPSISFAAGPRVAAKSAFGTNEFDVRVTADGYDQRQVVASMPDENDIVIRLLKTTANSIDMVLVRIPAGTFQMGSDHGDERPVHEVTLTRDFWIGKYEVTQGEYRAVTGASPSYFTGDDRLPMEQVSWNEAITFVNALSVAEAISPCYDAVGNVIGGDIYACDGYRLPAEAEWEYMARAGTTTAYSFGDDAEELFDFAWFAEGRTYPVGQKPPNPWGIYDVHGNVNEWTNDFYSGTYYEVSPSSDPPGPTSSYYRVQRGGHYRSGSFGFYNRSSFRGGAPPSYRRSIDGFRAARTAQ